MLRKHKNLWADLAFRSDHGAGGKVAAGVARGVRGVSRPLHGRAPTRSCPSAGTTCPSMPTWSRAWLADLPPDVAERIAWKNGEAVLRRGVAEGEDGPVAMVARAVARPSPRRPRVASAAAAASPPASRPGSRPPVASSRATSSSSIAPCRRAIEVGQHFAVEAVVCAGGAPTTRLRVDAQMPEHRHGMNYRARVAPQGDGRYRGRGPAVPHAGAVAASSSTSSVARPHRAADRRRPGGMSGTPRCLSRSCSRRPRCLAVPQRRRARRRSRSAASCGTGRGRSRCCAIRATASRAMRGAIALGQRLFFDPRLSANGAVACASCHVPTRGWTDGRAQAAGLGAARPQHADRARRRPSAAGSAGTARADSLWSSSVKPILRPARDGRQSARHVATVVRGDPTLACLYAGAFGAPPPGADDERVLVDAAQSARRVSWRRSARAARAFDDFRDALARGDRAAAATLSRRPRSAGCGSSSARASAASATSGRASPTASSTTIGMPFTLGPGRVDAGRHDGIKRLRAIRFNLLGPYSDDASGAAATKTRHVESTPCELRPVQDAVAAQRRAHRALHARRPLRERCATWCGTTRSSTWTACTPTARRCCGR